LGDLERVRQCKERILWTGRGKLNNHGEEKRIGVNGGRNQGDAGSKEQEP